MKSLGVTGGIGSGKTTICRIFEQHGARVFYADDEAKKLMTRPDVVELIRETFGPESYSDDGALNRSYLAQMVFPDPEMLRRLTNIVHPRLFEMFGHKREEADKAGVPLYVKEAAVLIESGGYRHVDKVLVVDAPEDERVRRVMLRDGASEADVRARIHNQWPSDRLRPYADYVIDTTQTKAEIETQVASIYNELARTHS